MQSKDKLRFSPLMRTHDKMYGSRPVPCPRYLPWQVDPAAAKSNLSDGAIQKPPRREIFFQLEAKLKAPAVT